MADNSSKIRTTNILFCIAIVFYLISPLFLVIFIIDQFNNSPREMLFWAFFLYSLLPCALTGTTFSIFGMVLSIRKKVKKLIIFGIVTTSIGILEIIGGLLGWALLTVVLS